MDPFARWFVVSARGSGLIASGGTLIFLGMLLFVYNIVGTVRGRPQSRA